MNVGIRFHYRYHYLVLVLFLASTLVGCSQGGQLNISSSSFTGKTKSTPFVQVNEGGKALIVEQGKSASTGIHGWMTIRPEGGGVAFDGDGKKMMFNRMVY